MYALKEQRSGLTMETFEELQPAQAAMQTTLQGFLYARELGNKQGIPFNIEYTETSMVVSCGDQIHLSLVIEES